MTSLNDIHIATAVTNNDYKEIVKVMASSLYGIILIWYCMCTALTSMIPHMQLIRAVLIC